MPWAGVSSRPSLTPKPPAGSGNLILANLRALCKVYNGESVEARQLDENASSRAIWIRVESHGPYSGIKLNFPYGFVDLQVMTVAVLFFYRTADCVLAIRP